MKVARNLVLTNIVILDQFEGTSKGLSKKVRSKITDHKMKTKFVQRENKAYLKRIEEEFDRFFEHTEESKKELDKAGREKYSNDLKEYTEEHYMYEDWLNEEIEIDLKPIFVSDLNDAEFFYNNMLFAMDEVFFSSEPAKLPKVKDYEKEDIL